MAESFSREKSRHAPQKNPVRPSSCVTPAGTSNELDVQNEWEENTQHTHTKFDFTANEGKERLNPSREKNKATCIAEGRWMKNYV